MATATEIIEKRNAFADALEKVAEMAQTVPFSMNDIPPKNIGDELRKFANCYRVRSSKKVGV